MKYILIILSLMIIDIQAVAQTPEQKQEFLDSLNKYRIAAGSNPVEYDYDADALAQTRVQTICKHLDDISEQEYNSDVRLHLHHDCEEDFKNYHSKVKSEKLDTLGRGGECSAYLTRWFSNNPASMHIKLFNGWKNSPDHFEAMMDSRYEYIALSWTYHKDQVVASLVMFQVKSR